MNWSIATWMFLRSTEPELCEAFVQSLSESLRKEIELYQGYLSLLSECEANKRLRQDLSTASICCEK